MPRSIQHHMDFNVEKKITPLKKLKVINNKEIYIKRDDLIHPLISGNKWRKLQGQAIQNTHEHIVTFGGAFSNHLVAVAYFAYILGVKSIGFVRTDKIDIKNPTLILCRRYNMQLIPINRNEYKEKEHCPTAQKYLSNIDNYLIIPEGGTNVHSSDGFIHVLEEIEGQLGTIPDIICCAYGTGGTSIGIASHMNLTTKLMINPALKGIVDEKIKQEIVEASHKKSTSIEIIPPFNNLRYGKVTDEILQTCETFLQEHGILLDPIYTSRLIASLEKDEFYAYQREYEKLVIYHSGGIQGWGGIFFLKPKLKIQYPSIYNAFIEYFESTFE